MRTVVVGLGNTLLADDGAGIRIVRGLRKKVKAAPGLKIKELSTGGLALLENIVNFDRAIIVDTISIPGGSPGKLHRLGPEDFRSRTGLVTGHQFGFLEAIEFGHRVNLNLPGRIRIYAIETGKTGMFSEELSKEIERRIPEIIAEIIKREFRKRR